MTRGKYIVIEGHDGTGKSTQVGLIREKLAAQGIESIEFHEPQGSPIADEIRTIIKNGALPRDSQTNLLLFTAARHEIWKQAQEKLANGVWVVAARNYFSTLAYQGYGEGLDLELITRTTSLFTDELYMKPDLAIILILDDGQERAKRIAERGELTVQDTFESRDEQFQAAVAAGYRELVTTYALSTISASQPKETITAQIFTHIDELQANT